MNVANPFTHRANPATKQERQENANWVFYEKMGADEELRAFDNARVKAPREAIANAHTWRWVEREYANAAKH